MVPKIEPKVNLYLPMFFKIGVVFVIILLLAAAIYLIISGKGEPLLNAKKTASPSPISQTKTVGPLPSKLLSLAGSTKSYSVELNQMNNSSLHALAKLQNISGRAVISITQDKGTTVSAKPVSIREGTCSKLGKTIYVLLKIEKGKSTTTLETNLAGLGKGLPLAIVSVNSFNELNKPILCGEISFN